MNGEVKPFALATVLNCWVQGSIEGKASQNMDKCRVAEYVLAKELWVTVWLPPRNSKLTKSPVAAVMTWGSKTNPVVPFWVAPTQTVWLAARAGATAARTARVAAANFMFDIRIKRFVIIDRQIGRMTVKEKIEV
jgi:hypothetical protein